jgi:hypothetical protein
MAGTFAGALEARQIDVNPERYQVEAIGEIVLEDKVLVIRRITVQYRLGVPDVSREEVERVHGFHARFCPVANNCAPSDAGRASCRRAGGHGEAEGIVGHPHTLGSPCVQSVW